MSNLISEILHLFQNLGEEWQSNIKAKNLIIEFRTQYVIGLSDPSYSF